MRSDPIVRYRPHNPEVFEPTAARARKIRCKVCGATGYPQQEWHYGDGAWFANPSWWGISHERAHGWDCTSCERAFTTAQGLSAHRRRTHP